MASASVALVIAGSPPDLGLTDLGGAELGTIERGFENADLPVDAGCFLVRQHRLKVTPPREQSSLFVGTPPIGQTPRTPDVNVPLTPHPRCKPKQPAVKC